METLQEVLTLRNIPLPAVLTDTDFRVIDYTASALEFLGLSRSQLKGLRLSEIFPPADRYYENDLARHDRDRFRSELTEIYPHPIRDEQWVELRMHTFEQGILLTMDDVTREIQLQELANRAASTVQIGSWEADLSSGKMYWSSTTRKIHGLPQDFQPTPETSVNFYKDGYSRDRIRLLINQAIGFGEPFDEELQIVTAQGTPKWVRVIGHSQMDNGSCVRVYGLFQDIDEQVRERMKFEELSQRYQMATEGGKVGVWDFHFKTDDLIWSDTMFELYDLPKSGFQGKLEDWERTLHPDDRRRAVESVRLAAENHTPFNARYRIITRRGNIRHIHAVAKMIYDAYGQPERMVGVNLDYTHQKRADERLRNLLNLTEEQNKSLVNYAHIVSHNLRSNSSNLAMLTRMLQRDNGEEERQQYLDMIQVSVDRLQETISHLNEVIRIRFEGEQEQQAVNLLSTLEHCTEGLNALIEECGAQFSLCVPSQFDVRGVPSYVESVFNNLITNAIKYRRDEVPLRVTVQAEAVDSGIRVRFRDNGKGIDLDRHGEDLFGMYKTFHGNRDARGIGLFLTRNHMQSMKGSINVASESGVGTEFILIFKRWEY